MSTIQSGASIWLPLMTIPPPSVGSLLHRFIHPDLYELSEAPGMSPHQQRQKLKSKSGSGLSHRLGSAPLRKRRCFSPQRRREVAEVRKAGACPECHRRKVRCDISHVLQKGASNSTPLMPPSLEEEINISFQGESDVFHELPSPAPPIPTSISMQFPDCPQSTCPSNIGSLSTTTQRSNVIASLDRSTSTGLDGGPPMGSSQRTVPIRDGIWSASPTQDRGISSSPSFKNYNLTNYGNKEAFSVPETFSGMGLAPDTWLSSNNVSSNRWGTSGLSTINTYGVEGRDGSFDRPHNMLQYGHGSQSKFHPSNKPVQCEALEAAVLDVQQDTSTYSAFAAAPEATYSLQGLLDPHYSAETYEDPNYWWNDNHHSY